MPYQEFLLSVCQLAVQLIMQFIFWIPRNAFLKLKMHQNLLLVVALFRILQGELIALPRLFSRLKRRVPFFIIFCLIDVSGVLVNCFVDLRLLPLFQIKLNQEWRYSTDVQCLYSDVCSVITEHVLHCFAERNLSPNDSVAGMCSVNKRCLSQAVRLVGWSWSLFPQPWSKHQFTVREHR